MSIQPCLHGIRRWRLHPCSPCSSLTPACTRECLHAPHACQPSKIATFPACLHAPSRTCTHDGRMERLRLAMTKSDPENIKCRSKTHPLRSTEPRTQPLSHACMHACPLNAVLFLVPVQGVSHRRPLTYMRLAKEPSVKGARPLGSSLVYSCLPPHVLHAYILEVCYPVPTRLPSL
jgi:hypothetical protein